MKRVSRHVPSFPGLRGRIQGQSVDAMSPRPASATVGSCLEKKNIRKIDVGRNDVKLNKIVRKINNTFFSPIETLDMNLCVLYITEVEKRLERKERGLGEGGVRGNRTHVM